MIHSFLLIGQSNMAGRGFATEVEPISTGHIKVLRNGRWQRMYSPINNDRSFAGVNLAESFALNYYKDKGVDVGLSPCADGGTCMDQWRPGGLLFDHAIYQCRLAARTSNIAGILWHQGEADCPPSRYPFYKEKLNVFLDELQRQLGIYDIPILLGGLGDFLADCTLNDDLKNYVKVNDALKAVADERKMTGFVSAEGLRSNPDNLHFCAKALREFGNRYYEKFLELEDKNKVFEEKLSENDAVRTEMELL